MSRLKIESHLLFTEDILNSLQKKNIYTVVNFLEADVKLLISLTSLSFRVRTFIKQLTLTTVGLFLRKSITSRNI